MYLSPRAAKIRNLSVATVNGTVTLIILLIAPLGLAAVIINTLLIAIASYATATAADRIVLFLQGDRSQQAVIDPGSQSAIHRASSQDLDHF